MTYTQAQFDRLPKWAQQVIETAERRDSLAQSLINEAQRFQQATQEDAALAVLNGPGRWDWRGDIVAVRNPYEDAIPVARDRDEIRFYFDSEDHHKYVDVSVRNGRVQVKADSGLVITARSSNTFSVYTEGR